MMEPRYYRQTGFFYSTSSAIPWTLWFAVAYISHTHPGEYRIITSLGSLLGLLTPLFIALYLILPHEGLRRDFINRATSFRGVQAKYLAVGFLLMPFTILSAQLLSLLLGYSIDQFQFRGGYTFSSGIFPVWFLLVFAPLVEELAWHSYGTDCLRSRFNLLTTSALFALIWGIWHLPLSFIKDYYHSNLMEEGWLYSANFFLSLFPFVLIMNWLYYKANRNIPITVIFHISAGYFNEIFATEPMSKVIQTVLLAVVAALLIHQDKTFFLTTKIFQK